MSRRAGAIFDAKEKELTENVIVPYLKEKGYPDIYYLPEAEREKWYDAVKPLHDEWIAEMEAKGLPGREFYEDLLKAAEKYNP